MFCTSGPMMESMEMNSGDTISQLEPRKFSLTSMLDQTAVSRVIGLSLFTNPSSILMQAQKSLAVNFGLMTSIQDSIGWLPTSIPMKRGGNQVTTWNSSTAIHCTSQRSISNSVLNYGHIALQIIQHGLFKTRIMVVLQIPAG